MKDPIRTTFDTSKGLEDLKSEFEKLHTQLEEVASETNKLLVNREPEHEVNEPTENIYSSESDDS